MIGFLTHPRRTFRSRGAAITGGGPRGGAGGIEIVDSVVKKNQSRRANGGGIFARSLSGDISLKGSTESGNVAARDGGIFSHTATKGIIKVRNGSLVSGNQPGQCFPARLKC